jgi:hypothetical protein
LWDYLKYRYENKDIGPFGVDIRSRSSRENLLCSFPEGSEGEDSIVSYPLHNLRFRVLEGRMKRKGVLSNNLKIKYLNNKGIFDQTLGELFYGLFALVKDFLFYW